VSFFSNQREPSEGMFTSQDTPFIGFHSNGVGCEHRRLI
jgi:hypothetical protein